MLNVLGNLYSITKQYEKAVKIEEVEISNILKKNNISYLNCAKLSEDNANRLVSLYLSLGNVYMNMEQHEKARVQYTIGYYLAYNHFGEYDVRTLKQAYNIACIDLLSGEQAEGISQLEYCYYDMREKLGESNEYTKKAKNTLLMLGENPDELYTKHMEMQRLAREELSWIWK